MDVLYILVPVALLLGFIGLVMMVVAARGGQFEDLEGPPHRILFDDDVSMIPPGSEARDDVVKEREVRP
jgi:cbb3-type cytochrome oxidase maturation protein